MKTEIQSFLYFLEVVNHLNFSESEILIPDIYKTLKLWTNVFVFFLKSSRALC